MGEAVTREFLLTAPAVHRPLSRCVLELSMEGRPTVMLVPVMLQNGNTPPAA
jgi:hypothetical protein